MSPLLLCKLILECTLNLKAIELPNINPGNQTDLLAWLLVTINQDRLTHTEAEENLVLGGHQIERGRKRKDYTCLASHSNPQIWPTISPFSV